MPDRHLSSDPQDWRFRRQYRALKPLLPVRLTHAEQIVLERAASHAAISEAAEANPSTHPNDLVRLANLARQSLHAWERLAAAKRAAQRAAARDAIPSLHELMAGLTNG
jgi:hypothetical protein